MDLAEDQILLGLDPENKDLSLKEKINLAKEMYKLNPDLVPFKDRGNEGNNITFITYADNNDKKQVKIAKGKVIEPAKIGIREYANE